jgi:hypothetical protein
MSYISTRKSVLIQSNNKANCNILALGRAMAQAVSRRPLTPESRVRSEAISCVDF